MLVPLINDTFCAFDLVREAREVPKKMYKKDPLPCTNKLSIYWTGSLKTVLINQIKKNLYFDKLLILG